VHQLNVRLYTEFQNKNKKGIRFTIVGKTKYFFKQFTSAWSTLRCIFLQIPTCPKVIGTCAAAKVQLHVSQIIIHFGFSKALESQNE
jgi:hypothetical protein